MIKVEFYLKNHEEVGVYVNGKWIGYIYRKSNGDYWEYTKDKKLPMIYLDFFLEINEEKW